MARERGKLTSATKLKLEHIIRLEMLSKSVEEIGISVGLAPNTVHELTRHPEYAAVRANYVRDVYEPVDQLIKQRKASTILEEAAPDAATALMELLNVEDDNVTRRLAARDILDRSGHGPIQRKVSKVRHEFDPITLGLIRDAMTESDMTDVIDVTPADE